MLRFIVLQGVRAHENVEHSQRRENITYSDRSRVVELFITIHAKYCGKSSQANLVLTYW